jgi:hypothetical protein
MGRNPDECSWCHGTGQVQGRTDFIGTVRCASCHGTGSASSGFGIERILQKEKRWLGIRIVLVVFGMIGALLAFISWLVYQYILTS